MSKFYGVNDSIERRNEGKCPSERYTLVQAQVFGLMPKLRNESPWFVLCREPPGNSNGSFSFALKAEKLAESKN